MKLEPGLYRKDIWKNKSGKLMLYIKLRKAFYRTLHAALLFLRLLSGTIIKWGFKLNEYDKAKQCTIIWHIDNLNISHIYINVVEEIFKMETKNSVRKVYSSQNEERY